MAADDAAAVIARPPPELHLRVPRTFEEARAERSRLNLLGAELVVTMKAPLVLRAPGVPLPPAGKANWFRDYRFALARIHQHQVYLKEYMRVPERLAAGRGARLERDLGRVVALFRRVLDEEGLLLEDAERAVLDEAARELAPPAPPPPPGDPPAGRA